MNFAHVEISSHYAYRVLAKFIFINIQRSPPHCSLLPNVTEADVEDWTTKGNSRSVNPSGASRHQTLDAHGYTHVPSP